IGFAAYHDLFFHLAFDELLALRVIAGLAFLAPFRLYDHVVFAVLAPRQVDLVLTPYAGDGREHVVDLARVDIDRPENEHIVRASEEPVVARQDGAARARAGDRPCEVPRPVSDERRRLFLQCRHDHLADLALGHGLKRVGVEEFHYVIIRPVVDTLVMDAVEAGTGAVELGHPRYIEYVLHAEELPDPGPHGVARPLRPEYHLLEIDLLLDPPLLHLLRHEEPHGGGAAQDGGAEIDEELTLHVEISRAHGYRHGAEALASVLEARARGPKSVADT